MTEQLISPEKLETLTDFYTKKVNTKTTDYFTFREWDELVNTFFGVTSYDCVAMHEWDNDTDHSYQAEYTKPELTESVLKALESDTVEDRVKCVSEMEYDLMDIISALRYFGVLPEHSAICIEVSW